MLESETFNFNDDLLTEVLAWLPPKSLSRFKSVSRHWRDLLSSPAFLRRHASAYGDGGRLVAFCQAAAVYETSDATTAKRCNVLPLCMEGNYINVPRQVGNFLHSSNGLILCCRIRGTLITYYVGNPFTGKFVELPLPYRGKHCLILDDQRLDKYDRRTSWGNRKKPPLLSSGLICKENGYTVLRAGMCYHERRIVHIDSYSSESGKWTQGIKELVATNSFRLSQLPPVVANGVVHWYTTSRDIAVYDPDGGDNHVQLVKVPNQRKDKNLRYAFTRSADDDVLWLAVQRRKNLLFYMLPKEPSYKRRVDIDSTEWELMHDVSILAISKLMKKGLIACEDYYLECLIPESGSEVVAVLQQEGKIFLYNVQRENIVKLDYSGRLNPYCELYPYFQSRLLPSYCP